MSSLYLVLVEEDKTTVLIPHEDEQTQADTLSDDDHSVYCRALDLLSGLGIAAACFDAKVTFHSDGSIEAEGELFLGESADNASGWVPRYFEIPAPNEPRPDLDFHLFSDLFKEKWGCRPYSPNLSPHIAARVQEYYASLENKDWAMVLKMWDYLT